MYRMLMYLMYRMRYIAEAEAEASYVAGFPVPLPLPKAR